MRDMFTHMFTHICKEGQGYKLSHTHMKTQTQTQTHTISVLKFESGVCFLKLILKLSHERSSSLPGEENTQVGLRDGSYPEVFCQVSGEQLLQRATPL